MSKIFIFIAAFVFLFALEAKADVPPDTGYKRVSIDLVTETNEDLSDYRFFLDFYGDLREVQIISKGRTTIPPMGGGARYSSGSFWAIPKKSLGGLEEKPTSDQLKNLSESIKAKKIEGAVELAKHRFSADVLIGTKPATPHYLIKRGENTLTAERVEENSDSSSSPLSVATGSRTTLVISGIFLTLAMLAIGVFAFRKVSKKV